MPHTITAVAAQMSHTRYFSNMLTAVNSGREGDTASFFVQGPRLALRLHVVAKTCPHVPTDHRPSKGR